MSERRGLVKSTLDTLLLPVTIPLRCGKDTLHFAAETMKNALNFGLRVGVIYLIAKIATGGI